MPPKVHRGATLKGSSSLRAAFLALSCRRVTRYEVWRRRTPWRGSKPESTSRVKCSILELIGLSTPCQSGWYVTLRRINGENNAMCLSQFITDLALITNHANVLSSGLTAMLLLSLLGSGIFKMRVA